MASVELTVGPQPPNSKWVCSTRLESFRSLWYFSFSQNQHFEREHWVWKIGLRFVVLVLGTTHPSTFNLLAESYWLRSSAVQEAIMQELKPKGKILKSARDELQALISGAKVWVGVCEGQKLVHVWCLHCTAAQNNGVWCCSIVYFTVEQLISNDQMLDIPIMSGKDNCDINYISVHPFLAFYVQLSVLHRCFRSVTLMPWLPVSLKRKPSWKILGLFWNHTTCAELFGERHDLASRFWHALEPQRDFSRVWPPSPRGSDKTLIVIELHIGQNLLYTWKLWCSSFSWRHATANVKVLVSNFESVSPVSPRDLEGVLISGQS